MSRIAVLIVAAGKSSRFGADVPKPWVPLAGRMVAEHAIAAFAKHPAISEVALIVHPEHQEFCSSIDIKTIYGGAERYDSVQNGLKALAENPPDVVLIHDAARPMVSAEVIDRVLAGLKVAKAVIPALAVTDTIKQVADAVVTGTPAREHLRAVQTPQGFDYAALCAAYASCDPAGATDDAMMMEQAGHAVCVVDGDEKNRKLTTQADLVWMRAMMERVETRSGQGFDVHQLYEDEARKLMICGVEVASPLALRGHSDADVGLHALVDAMLGALGHGDIGQHFPPSDDRWKDVDSADFVAEAVRLMHASGGRLVNADITIIGEVPKIGPYREVMRARVAELLGVEEARVNIKATTTEKLGFTGRKEGLAAQALVNIETGGMK